MQEDSNKSAFFVFCLSCATTENQGEDLYTSTTNEIIMIQNLNFPPLNLFLQINVKGIQLIKI